MSGHSPGRACQGGTLVEFALATTALMLALFGIVEFGRIAYLWNAASEATRLGARAAIVCGIDAAGVRGTVTAMFPQLAATDILVSYQPAGCGPGSCSLVTVSLDTHSRVRTYIPWLPLSLTLPPFPTTLSVESLDSSTNPTCR